jgi:hypothetical protein
LRDFPQVWQRFAAVGAAFDLNLSGKNFTVFLAEFEISVPLLKQTPLYGANTMYETITFVKKGRVV